MARPPGTLRPLGDRLQGLQPVAEDGTWVRIVTSLLDELDDKKQIDHDLWCIDGTVIRASRAAAGGGKKGEQFVAVGRT